MEFKEISSPTIKELFVSEIEAMIISGRMKPGEAFPTEREMAQQMHISRSIINQGMRELDAKGFVEIVPRQGTFVADYKTKGNMETLIDIQKYNGNRFDRHTFFSIMQVRQVVEKHCTELACRNATSESMEAAWKLLHELENAKNAQEWAKANFALHHYISIVSGNTIYPLIWRSFEKSARAFLEDCYRLMDVKVNFRNTEIYLSAIENHNEEVAVETMDKIFQQGRIALQDFYYGIKEDIQADGKEIR